MKNGLLRKLSAFLLIFTLLVLTGTNVLADPGQENKVTLRVNCKTISIPNEPEAYSNSDGRTMVPVRFVADQLGAVTDWDGNTKTVTITKGDKAIQFKVGEKKVLVNGVEMELDTCATTVQDRTFVPIRFIAEAFGAYVGWSQVYTTASIYLPENLTVEDLKRLRSYPVKTEHPEKDSPDHSYEDSNVYQFMPALKSMNKKLHTHDGIFQYSMNMYKRGEQLINNYYTFDYRKLDEYRERMYDIWPVKGNGYSIVDGQAVSVEDWVEHVINRYAEKKAVTEAYLYADPSLIYSSNTGGYGIRGVLKYKVNETTDRWFFDCITPHETGIWYEADIDFTVYISAATYETKLRNPIWLSPPRSASR